MIRLFAAAILSLVFLTSTAHAKGNSKYDIRSLNAPVKIAVLGDGLYSGFGLFQPSDSYMARLEGRLKELRFSKKIEMFDHTNEGIRTATAIQFLPSLLADKPEVVVVGLGYTDALASADIDTMYNNLDTILTQLYRSRAYVLLLQPSLPQSIEHNYVSRFNDMYSKLGKRYDNVVFISEFMDDVVKNPYAFDESLGYPTELGATMMLDNTEEHISEAIRKIKRMRAELYYER